jgi:hypothetical protein
MFAIQLVRDWLLHSIRLWQHWNSICKLSPGQGVCGIGGANITI